MAPVSKKISRELNERPYPIVEDVEDTQVAVGRQRRALDEDGARRRVDVETVAGVGRQFGAAQRHRRAGCRHVDAVEGRAADANLFHQCRS